MTLWPRYFIGDLKTIHLPLSTDTHGMIKICPGGFFQHYLGNIIRNFADDAQLDVANTLFAIFHGLNWLESSAELALTDPLFAQLWVRVPLPVQSLPLKRDGSAF